VEDFGVEAISSKVVSSPLDTDPVFTDLEDVLSQQTEKLVEAPLSSGIFVAGKDDAALRAEEKKQDLTKVLKELEEKDRIFNNLLSTSQDKKLPEETKQKEVLINETATGDFMPSAGPTSSMKVNHIIWSAIKFFSRIEA
jgi:hypothetical protein